MVRLFVGVREAEQFSEVLPRSLSLSLSLSLSRIGSRLSFARSSDLPPAYVHGFPSQTPFYDECNVTRISHETCASILIAIVADYLLSNNHVNAIIVHKFDFSDEEVMAYYISFLKTLSFRLNKHTIHFFYNEVS